MKILLIEDDLMLANGLVKALSAQGYTTECENTGVAGLNCAAMVLPDLVILDLGLPDIDGTEVLAQLRKTAPLLPVLVLTARDRIADKVAVLDGGADDYISKPFEMDEFLARIRVLARRLGTASSSAIVIGDVSFDLAGSVAKVSDKNLSLTSRELMILKALMLNSGRIQTKQMIEDKLYGWGDEVASNAIEVHVSNLRKKLPNEFIRTVRGVGYTIDS